jgi:hypothetical protein
MGRDRGINMLDQDRPFLEDPDRYYFKEVKTYFDKIHVVENFISPHTAKMLTAIQNQYLTVTPHNQYISGGLSGNAVTPYEYVSKYTGDPAYDLSLDLFQLISVSMVKAVSDFYGTPFVAKSMFYSHMKPGAENKLHMDNHYVDSEGGLKIREHEYEDRAALLYLNEEYTGGELFFPFQDFEYKPKTGTLVFFEGDYSLPHGVKKVESGERINMISFLYHERDKMRPRVRPMYETEVEITKEMLEESVSKGIVEDNKSDSGIKPWYGWENSNE